MSRRLNYEIPGTDWRRSTLDLADGGWRGLFSPDFEPRGDLVLEIGFGRGEFLLDLAAKSPATPFIGIEVSFKRVLKMARKVAAAGLRNVRLIESRGEVVVADLLEPESVEDIWINFSDPWPKDAHAHRRLIQPGFVRAVSRCLVPGGRLQVATDDVTYSGQIDEVLAAEPLLENVFAPDRHREDVPGRTWTGYEADWRAAGRPMHFFTYRRCSPLSTRRAATESGRDEGTPRLEL
jgi:tRNA (guanine-N7-)-methyltransferase